MSPTAKTIPAKDLRHQIKLVHERIRAFIAARGNSRLKELWPAWETRLNDIFEQANERPEVAISLVGGTGAGKSTLLNALIGVRILPVANMRACTAATCEVSYAEGPYQARVEFIPRESWEHEVNLLLVEHRAAQDPSDNDPATDPGAQMSRAVRDKLWTVYRPSEDSDSASFDPFHLTEPAEIKAALDAGMTEWETSDLKAFRKEVARYLDSQHRFWPIVKSVIIHGPFEALRDGAKIIDLPGINDPNESREEVTKNHLKTCRFVWLVFNIKRALTKDTIHLMQSDDFLRQVVMDGRADSLTFVGTAADDVDLETGIEEFNLDEDAGISEVVKARNAGVREVILAQLDDLSIRLASLAREQREVADRLAGRLRASKIFTVSAREYLRIEGLAKNNPAGFSSAEQTEIPALVGHMRSICAAYGWTAHCQALQRQLELVIAEIRGELQAQQAILKNRVEVSERGQKEVRAAVDAARAFLDRDLDSTRERLVQDLESGQSVLAERVKLAVERARQELTQTFARWERMHPRTIKAVCVRGGTHTGAHRNDFPADLSKPILDGIAFAWSDFFGERLKQILEKWTDRLVRLATGHRERLDKSLATASDVPRNAAANLDAIFQTNEKVLQELLAQTNNAMEGKIQHEQRTLYESVPDQVKANMQTAFAKASEENGPGMKRRMVEALATHANKVSQVMFDDARDALINGVRNLNDWLAREFDKMIAAAQRNASLAADNLVTSGQRMTGEAIASEQAVLDELGTVLKDEGL